MKKIFIMIFVLLFIFGGGTSFSDHMSSYVLGPGDTIEIRAWSPDDPDILVVNPITAAPGVQIHGTDTHSVTVSRDGRIYVPLIGVLNVWGMKVSELEQNLKTRLKKFARGAEVVVLLRRPKPVNVYVLGQVNAPGLYSVPDGNPEEARVMNYVNLAGGFTRFANKRNVKVIRRAGGTEEAIKIDLQEIELKRDLSSNIVLKEGDAVIISSQANMVYVLGEVMNPGAYEHVEGAGLVNYISMAGGLTKSAVNEIGIVRGEEVKKVNVNDMMNFGREGSNIAAGDVIFVPQNFYANWADILGTLRLVRDSLAIPRDTRDAYLDITGQPRKTYIPTE